MDTVKVVVVVVTSVDEAIRAVRESLAAAHQATTVIDVTTPPLFTEKQFADSLTAAGKLPPTDIPVGDFNGPWPVDMIKVDIVKAQTLAELDAIVVKILAEKNLSEEDKAYLRVEFAERKAQIAAETAR